MQMHPAAQDKKLKHIQARLEREQEKRIEAGGGTSRIQLTHSA
jgi:hypothetical protein